MLSSDKKTLIPIFKLRLSCVSSEVVICCSEDTGLGDQLLPGMQEDIRRFVLNEWPEKQHLRPDTAYWAKCSC